MRTEDNDDRTVVASDLPQTRELFDRIPEIHHSTSDESSTQVGSQQIHHKACDVLENLKSYQLK